ncbi:MAG: alpha/beta hydrolase, partial [Thermoplasmata archaeon]
MILDVAELRKDFDAPHHLLVASDGLTLFLWKWEPQTEYPRKSALLLLHGLTAYCGAYSMMTEPLAERGFTIYGLDLRGHGLSDGNRGDCPNEDRLVKDICEAIDFVKERHETVVLLAHSLGVLSSIYAMN